MTLQTPDLEAAKAIVLLQHEDEEDEDPSQEQHQKATGRGAAAENRTNVATKETTKTTELTLKETIVAENKATSPPLLHKKTRVHTQRDDGSALVATEEGHETSTCKTTAPSPGLFISPIDTSNNQSPVQCYLTMSPVTATTTLTTCSPLNKKRSRSPDTPRAKHHKKSKTFFIGGQDLSYGEEPPRTEAVSRQKTLECFAGTADKHQTETPKTKHHKKSKKFFTGGQDLSYGEEPPCTEGLAQPKPSECSAQQASHHQTEPTTTGKYNHQTESSSTGKEDTLVETLDQSPAVEAHSEQVEPREGVVPANYRKHKKENYIDLSDDASDGEKKDPTPQRVGIHSEQMKLIDAIVQKLSGRAQENFKAIAAKAISRHQMGDTSYDHLPNAILRNVQRLMQPTDYMGAYTAVRNSIKENPDAAPKNHCVSAAPSTVTDPARPRPRNGVEHYGGHGGIRPATKHQPRTNQYAVTHKSHPCKVPPAYVARSPSSKNYQHSSLHCNPATLRQPPAPPQPRQRQSSVPPHYPGVRQSPVPQYDRPVERQSPVSHRFSTRKVVDQYEGTPKPSEDHRMFVNSPAEAVGVAVAPRKQTSPALKEFEPSRPVHQAKKRSATETKKDPNANPKSALKTAPKMVPKKRTTVKDQDLAIPSKAELQDAQKTGLQLALRYGYALGLKHGRSRPIHDILEQAESKLTGMTAAERNSLWDDVAEYTKE